MSVDATFEGGRIEVIDDSDPDDLRVSVPADPKEESQQQWFSFVVRGLEGEGCQVTIENAADCTYPDAFEDYAVRASVDGEDWFLAETDYDGEVLTFGVDDDDLGGADAVHFAYFAPFSAERRAELVARAVASGLARVSEVARSVEDRPVTSLSIGSQEEGAKQLWIVARQHPGETMAEWAAQAIVERLIDPEDELTERLRKKACVHVVTCMNPDGAALGNHRTNAAGIDLNRVWSEPDADTSPEVLGVQAAMKASGVDFFLDIHGDERTPYVFFCGGEGNPHYTDRIAALEQRFDEAMIEACSHFQTEEGYPKDAPGDGDLRCASNWAGDTYDCLALTLEMPFTDDANDPDTQRGWSPERCARVGEGIVEALARCVGELR